MVIPDTGIGSQHGGDFKRTAVQAVWLLAWSFLRHGAVMDIPLSCSKCLVLGIHTRRRQISMGHSRPPVCNLGCADGESHTRRSRSERVAFFGILRRYGRDSRHGSDSRSVLASDNILSLLAYRRACRAIMAKQDNW